MNKRFVTSVILLCIILFGYSLTSYNKKLNSEQPNSPIPATPEIELPMDYCPDATAVAKYRLEQEFAENLTVHKPFANQTLNNLPVFYRFKTTARYVALQGDLTAQYQLDKPSPDSLAQIADIVETPLTQELAQVGYTKNFSSAGRPDYVTHFATFENAEYAYMVSYNEIPGATPGDDTISIEFLCAPITASLKQMYLKLLTYPAYAKNPTRAGYIQLIASDTLDPDTMKVFGLNISDLTQYGGYAQYLILNGNRFELVYEGQESPPCSVFESRNVGTGVWCYDDVQQKDRTVNF